MSDKVQRYYKYRGQVTSLCYHDEKLLFVTKHDEGQSTAVYILDPDSGSFESYNLPCSATDAIVHDDSLLVTGTDGYIHHLNIKSLKLKTLDTQIEPNASCIVYLNKKEFAVLCENTIYILSIKKASILSQIDLEQKTSHLVSSPDGNWLVTGNVAGEIVVFSREDSDQFVFSDSKKIHQGAITSLAFDSDELRVLSSGNDYKLFMTHVRGELEPEDKSDSSAKAAFNNIIERDNKCYGTDTLGNIKVWEKGKKRFSTIKSAKSTALVFANWKDKPHLVVAKKNNDIAFFPLEEKKHIGSATLAISDAYNWAEHEINKDPRQCEPVLKELALFNDKKAIDLIYKVVTSNTDVGICVAATELLASTEHQLAFRFLEELLKSQGEKVRIAAFVGLSSSQKILPTIQLALKTGFENIGILAIDALKTAAEKDEEAMEFLVATLNYKSEVVRQRVLKSLGEIYGEKSSEAEIIAFGSDKEDIRRLALIRLLQKNLLSDLNVQSVLRSSLEDKSDTVRFTGFVICLLQDLVLVEVLRSKSSDLHRQIYEIENWGKESKSKKIPAAKKTTKKLTENNLQVLFQAMACNHIETSLKGAYYLALLEDTRALGTLLQLSRASSANIRVQVCIAFRKLKDPHATQRLNMMLQDKDMQVRDVAFSALEKIYEKNPLVVVESGFAAADPEIVHDRSLHLVVAHLKKTKKKNEKTQCLSLLQQALNNTTISNEAFKVILALDFLTMEERLQLILKSIDSTIRKKVLIELKPQLKNDWAWNLLLEMQQDSYAEIRYQAFEMAKKQKRDIVQVLEKASACPYADIRELATTALARKVTKDTRRLLLKMISDNQKNIRQLAIEAFVANGAEEELLVALDSKHSDVRNYAAQALAWFGNNKALPQLQQLLQQPKPKRDPEKEWQQQIIIAINGVANLFSFSSLDLVIPFLDSDDKVIRETCAKALFWLSNQNDHSFLQEKLSHKDQNVQREIAFALAYYEDRSGLAIVQKFSEDKNYLIAAFSLRQKNEEMFLSPMINQSTHTIQNLALRTLLLYMTQYRNPDLLISLLSSIYPHIRLMAISALEHLADESKFQQFVWDFINKRQDGKTWTVDEQKLQTLTNVLASSDSHLTVWVIKHLLTRLEDQKRKDFDQNWLLFEKRFAKRIEKLKVETFDYNLEPQQAQQIIFGAYVGLSRIRRDQTKFAHYRQVALSKLCDIAQKDKTLQLSVQSVMFLTLNDCSALVREQAFAGLQNLGTAIEDLTTQVFVTGHIDICKLALELLINKQKKSDVSKMLSDIQKSFDNGLEVEVSHLLVDKQGGIKTWEAALTAKSPSLRKMAVNKLIELYDEDKKSHKVLHSALQSPYKEIREQVAFSLAMKKDEYAFEPLSKLLFSNDRYTQKTTINALRKLQHPESTTLFVKRIENDPAETALAKEMLNAVGHFRNPKDIDVLNTFIEHKKTFTAASDAWLTISGFDQEIQDIEHDGDWFKKQHPRHLEVFQKLLDKWYHLGKYKSIVAQKNSLYWIKDNSIDSTLQDWCTISDERVRHTIITIVGWRLRKRDGTNVMLQKCLQSQEIIDRFLAAEALALHQDAAGLNILRTCLETLPELNYRRRAVKAVGVLANDNAFDTLYDITSNSEHALYEEAVEALGHLRKSKKAKVIFEKLQKILSSSTYNTTLICKVLHGLRWFNDHNSWNLIRSYMEHNNWEVRLKVAELLQFNDDNANIDTLQKIIRKDNDYDVLNQAHVSLRKITKAQSFIVEEALLQCSQNLLEDGQIEKFSQQTPFKKLFDVLPKIQNQSIANILISKVLEREDLTAKDALNAIKTNDYNVISLAAHIIARTKLTKAQHKIATDSLAKLWQDFSVDLNHQQKTNAKILHKEEKLLACSYLVWACGRIKIAKDTICAILETKNQQLFHLHCICVCALENFSGDKAVSQTLINTAKNNASFIRNFASFTLAVHKEADITLATELIDHRNASHHILQSSGKKVLELTEFINEVHYQGILLPLFVQHGEVKILLDVAKNTDNSEQARLGAIEGLAVIADDKAQKALEKIAKVKKQDKEVCKAAWRALRRAKRRQKAS
ncbi:HEAT repeat domain-containing protein [Candidatus Uabimicrobium sp. HlEnr_7]|uniref:HEAT repeat domain-containing protein n=1 Tax=Candidatus Uabimicrobium helgolandensis TaxID=3095367 RepID=UPI003557F02D